MCLVISHRVFKSVFGRKTDPPLDKIELTGTHYEEWKDIIYESIGRLRKLGWKEIFIKGVGGDRLKGLYHDNGSDKTAVLCHGYRAHYFGNTALAAGYFLDRGYNLILLVLRGHEGSEGKYITFGAFEHKDLLLWIDTLIKKYGQKKLVLYGNSLGSNSIMRASEFIDTDKVKAIIADCGFINSKTVLNTQVKNKANSAFQRMVYSLVFIPVIHGMRFFSKRAGFDIFAGDTRVSVSRTKVPIFFLHGANDKIVNVKETEENYRACGSPKEMFIASRAGHGAAFADGGEKLRERLDEFLGRYI